MPGNGLRLLLLGILATSVTVAAQQTQRTGTPGSASAGASTPNSPSTTARPAPAAMAAHRPAATATADSALVQKYCVTCHNARLKTASLLLDELDLTKLGEHVDIAEKVVRKMRAGLMPPTNMPRPDAATWDTWITSMER